MKNKKSIVVAVIMLFPAITLFSQVPWLRYGTNSVATYNSSDKVSIGFVGASWMLDVANDINLNTNYNQYTHGTYRINDEPVLHTWGAVNFGTPTTTCLSVGIDAGKSNAGYDNTFTGSSAGYSNTTGSDNSFSGYQAGVYNTTGVHNNFMGSNSGSMNTTGSDNSFYGYNTGNANTTASYNSFFGSSAGSLCTTSYSTIVGSRSFYQSTTGSGNSALGALSGYSNTTGGYNLFAGLSCGYSNTTGNYNSFLGSYAGNSNTTGSNNVLIGAFAAYAIANTGSQNIAIGYNSQLGSGLTNAIAIGSGANVANSNSMSLGSASSAMKVGVGISAPGYTFQLAYDDAAKPGTSTWTIASDARLKKDITPFKDGLDVLNKINPVWFSYNGKAGMPTDKKYVGIIAQEMQKIAPYTVGTYHYQDTTGNKEDYLDYNANAVTYIIINSIKQQQQQLEKKDSVIKSLKDELAKMKDQGQEELNAMKDRMNAFENSLSQCCMNAQNNTAANSGTVLNNEAPVLEQNAPNPFNESTTIKYYVPQSSTSAAIKILSMEGIELFSVAVSAKGNGQTEIEGNNFSAGKYIYQLIINGKIAVSKTMILVK